MTPFEVAEAFGTASLAKIVEDGGLSIVRSPDEPARTLKAQRNTLGLTVEEVARECGIPKPAVVAAETAGKLNPVRTLERLAQQVGLNEHRIGLGQELGDARELGARLKRRLSRPGRSSTRRRDPQDEAGAALTPITVLRLAEAAWVIARQAELEELLPIELRVEPMAKPRTEPLFPGAAWRQGYELAGRARDLFGLDGEEPIPSLRSLLDERNGIPLLALLMNENVAGATLANGRHRGIVVNSSGLNENVWIRRTTAAHELCHFLWDLDENLDRLRVDTYEDVLAVASRSSSSGVDRIEQRANAFAVEFLAPRRGIVRLVQSAVTREEALSLISQNYGISISAASNHLDNSNHGNPKLYGEAHLSIQPSDEWRASEDFGLDFFPMRSCPYARRGRFAQLAARAVGAGRLTADSGALLLAVPIEEFQKGFDGLRELDLRWGEQPSGA
ncbi:MAG: ImmA/IrrE family metallo-endopeptidase [Alphaproteobacteria bacterium]|nr:ImmA/IrrE family metallo-endopeptidase [Alphaproteobacteria bacterium]